MEVHRGVFLRLAQVGVIYEYSTLSSQLAEKTAALRRASTLLATQQHLTRQKKMDRYKALVDGAVSRTRDSAQDGDGHWAWGWASAD